MSHHDRFVLTANIVAIVKLVLGESFGSLGVVIFKEKLTFKYYKFFGSNCVNELILCKD